MVTFLIVLIAILVICCCIMLYLYFSVRKEADNYEHEYRRYSELYEKSHKLTRELSEEKEKLEYTLKRSNADHRACVNDLYNKIQSLNNQIDDHTIKYTRTTVEADDVNSSIVIPRNIFTNEDPAESSLFYKSAWNLLVDLVVKDILEHSTIFHVEYDVLRDSYHLCFHYKKFISRSYKSDWYHINPQSESPIKDLMNRIREKEAR